MDELPQIKIVTFQCGCTLHIYHGDKYRLIFCECHYTAPALRSRLQQVLPILNDYSFWRDLEHHLFINPSLIPKIEEIKYQIRKINTVLENAGDRHIPALINPPLGEKEDG